MGEKNDFLETAVIEFYRGEIRQRYQLERLRQIREFNAIPDAMLEALSDFFLERLYPTMEVRAQMDEAFDDLAHLLRSPGRMRPLVGSALKSMFRLSFHLPAIISTGLATVDAIKETRKLETGLMAVAEPLRQEFKALLGGGKSTQKYRRAMLRLVAGVPESTVRSLIEDVIRLFRALSDVKMLSGMLYLMEQCLHVMESRRDVYTDKDRESMELGLEVLRGGHDLFLQLKPSDFPKILKGIDRVETTWYEDVLAGAEDPSD